jgi:hypothetical protein
MAYTDHANGAFLTRAGNYNLSKVILDEEITLKRYFDCSTDNLTASAYYKIFSVPANFCLLNAYLTCLTAESSAGTDTIDVVDDDSSTTTFVSNGALATAGTVTATNSRKTYTSAGFICLKPDNDLTTAKFEVIIKGVLIKTSD